MREDGTFDDKIEHMLDRGIERPGLAALWQLKEGRVIPSWNTRESIATFLAVQYTRVPDIRGNVHRILEALADFHTEEILRDEDLMATRLQRTESMDREEAKITVKKLKGLVKAGHIKPVVKQESSMKMLFDVVEESADGFMAMDWTVFVAPKPSFFTSDIPVDICPSVIGDGGIGMSTGGSVVHVPLSSRRFLLMGGGVGNRSRRLSKLQGVLPRLFLDQLERQAPVVSYLEASIETIQRLNLATAVFAGEWLCGSHESKAMAHALGKPRVRGDFHIMHVNRGIKIGHRHIVDE